MRILGRKLKCCGYLKFGWKLSKVRISVISQIYKSRKTSSAFSKWAPKPNKLLKLSQSFYICQNHVISRCYENIVGGWNPPVQNMDKTTFDLMIYCNVKCRILQNTQASKVEVWLTKVISSCLLIIYRISYEIGDNSFVGQFKVNNIWKMTWQL